MDTFLRSAAGRSGAGAAVPSTSAPQLQPKLFRVAAADAARRRRRCRRSSSSNVAAAAAASSSSRSVTLLDYGAGNVRSVRNAIKALGYELKEVESAADIVSAETLIFPGVGAYEQAMGALRSRDLLGALKDYVSSGDRPFFGICLGLQLLFEGSEENGGVEGLGIIPGRVTRFDEAKGLPIPHIGWNDLKFTNNNDPKNDAPPPPLLARLGDRRVYFVHSFRATPTAENAGWVAATSEYGGEFIAAVSKGQVAATQFHPEKSGAAGLDVLRGFLEGRGGGSPSSANASPSSSDAALTQTKGKRGLAKRVIACLDVRANDAGDLVVTKGDQYDVRETSNSSSSTSSSSSSSSGDVRNLGKPVDLAARYYEEGADEVTFLNITGFRETPLRDLPMLAVLRAASERVFVPLTVGGGIREAKDPDGTRHSSLDVAAEYFRSGADKVSIGSDAVEAAIKWYANGKKGDGTTAIERISWAYGAQAVVVSIDPRRVWVKSPSSTERPTVKVSHGKNRRGPDGEEHCWWQCTVKGGREGRDLDAVELAVAVEALGAGEILLNCIDRDGTGDGFDLDLVKAVSDAVGIPVIASSGAGSPRHFTEVFEATRCSAALAAGIFHRHEVEIADVKREMSESGIPTRVG